MSQRQDSSVAFSLLTGLPKTSKRLPSTPMRSVEYINDVAVFGLVSGGCEIDSLLSGRAWQV
jgi:hypothetical protein